MVGVVVGVVVKGLSCLCVRGDTVGVAAIMTGGD